MAGNGRKWHVFQPKMESLANNGIFSQKQNFQPKMAFLAKYGKILSYNQLTRIAQNIHNFSTVPMVMCEGNPQNINFTVIGFALLLLTRRELKKKRKKWFNQLKWHEMFKNGMFQPILAFLAKIGILSQKWKNIELHSTYKDCIENPQILKCQWS